MNPFQQLNQLNQLNDQRLHQQLKDLARQERALLTQVLEHLGEVERRRLYSDFGRSSLFDYAVKELGYSEDQAHRRIQAMRLIKAVPEVKEKLNSGALSLTNAAKAQNLFRKSDKSKEVKPMDKQNKLALLGNIEHKSTREAERELLKHQPLDLLPSDRQKAVSAEHTEIRVVLDQDTLSKLEEVKALLGPKGVDLTHNELLQIMADATIDHIKGKRFGKRRVEQPSEVRAAPEPLGAHKAEDEKSQETSELTNKNPRYVSAATKHAVWKRDQGKCCKCGSRRNLQFDHVQPIGLNGKTGISNIRLLCFSCNQRAGMRVYGVDAMHAAVQNSRRETQARGKELDSS